MKCPHCAGPVRFAGYVSNPAKTIYHCDACNKSEWTEGLPWRGQDQAQQPHQQPQAKLEPEE